MLAQRPALVAERGVDQSDITWLSGQKQPSWPSGECFGKTFEPFWRNALRIDGQRNQENIATYALAQLLLHLRNPRRRERADVRTVPIDDADQHSLAIDFLVIQCQRLA